MEGTCKDRNIINCDVIGKDFGANIRDSVSGVFGLRYVLASPIEVLNKKKKQRKLEFSRSGNRETDVLRTANDVG